MNTIEAFEREIKYQVTDLKKFLGSSNIKCIERGQQERCIFTGAGDSYAVALIAELASDNRINCIDPMDVCINPSVLKGKFLYTISVSGRTSANIEAAKVANKVAERIIAITADANSKLANICDEVIELKFRSSGIQTAGSIGFTACMLACLALVRNVHISNIKQLFKQAEKSADNITVNDNMYLVGSWITYPLAIYGSAKMYEVFGIKAQYAMLEQFCHMELFSLKKSDMVLLLPADENKNASELSKKLINSDYNVIVLEPYGNNLEEKLLYHAMLLQLIALKNAKKRHLTDCYFVNTDLRDISSSLIY